MAGAPVALRARLLVIAAAGCCCLILLPPPPSAAAAAAPARLLLASPSADADAEALLEFKDGIKSHDDALSSWSPGTSPCDGDASSWSGVICHKDAVVGLQLEKMGLSGKLDLLRLKSLTGLRTVSFMDNELAGPMPDVRELSGLRAIFLSGNNLSGEIPARAFDGMGSLKKVYLSNNNFSGPIPASLAGVPRLLELLLHDNKFHGRIPDLPQKGLKVVNVANNELEGEIPASLKFLNPDMFAGNKKLCGRPLGTKCEAPSSPAPAPRKHGRAPSSSLVPAALALDVKRTEQPAGGSKVDTDDVSMPSVVFMAFLGLLALVVFAFVALKRRRRYKTRNFGPSMSSKSSTRRVAAEPASDAVPQDEPRDVPVPAADAAAAAGGGAGRKVAEQGRLTFVREHERGRFFELPDLLKATAEVLGASSSNLGLCYRATLTGGESVVVKRFKDMNRVGREDFEEHMRRLGRLSHPNLLPLVAYYYRKEEKLLMHDFVPNKSLADLLHGEGRGIKRAVVHWAGRLRMVKGVARALSYMYDELPMLTVPHGHLKASNVLLDERFEPLLTDYALVPVMNQSHAAQLMVAFKSPERRQFGRSSKKSDVWCLGLLILEIVTGRPPSYDLHPVKPPPPPDPEHHLHHQQQQQRSAADGAVDLAGLVASTPEEEWLQTVVDGDLSYEEEEAKGEMVKLIRIAMACCEGAVDSRWELKMAAERIEELRGKWHDDEEHSFYSSIGDAGADRDHDFAAGAGFAAGRRS